MQACPTRIARVDQGRGRRRPAGAVGCYHFATFPGGSGRWPETPKAVKHLARPEGFEPPTYGFVVRRSIRLATGAHPAAAGSTSHLTPIARASSSQEYYRAGPR